MRSVCYYFVISYRFAAEQYCLVVERMTLRVKTLVSHHSLSLALFSSTSLMRFRCPSVRHPANLWPFISESPKIIYSDLTLVSNAHKIKSMDACYIILCSVYVPMNLQLAWPYRIGHPRENFVRTNAQLHNTIFGVGFNDFSAYKWFKLFALWISCRYLKCIFIVIERGYCYCYQSLQ